MRLYMKIKLLSLLSILGLFLQISAMEMPDRIRRQTRSAMPPRKIAILDWGRLSRKNNSLEMAGDFRESSLLKLPVELARLSNQGKNSQKITRVIDQQEGMPTPIAYASSKVNCLRTARETFANELSTIKDNIFYIKTMLPGKRAESTEKALVSESGRPILDSKANPWYMFAPINAQLSKQDIIAIAEWATIKGYDAVIWSGLGKNRSHTELLQLLETDENTLNNTIAYIDEATGRLDIHPFMERGLVRQLTVFEVRILKDFPQAVEKYQALLG